MTFHVDSTHPRDQARIRKLQYLEQYIDADAHVLVTGDNPLIIVPKAPLELRVRQVFDGTPERFEMEIRPSQYYFKIGNQEYILYNNI